MEDDKTQTYFYFNRKKNPGTNFKYGTKLIVRYNWFYLINYGYQLNFTSR